MDPRPLVVIAGIAAAAWLQGAAGENNAVRRRNDFRYTPDPRVIRLVAGAHRSSTADAIWLRALPDMSREFSDPAAKARWIRAALEVVTDLEPSFVSAYAMGESYLTVIAKSSPGAIDHAISLLEKGIRNNPDWCGLYVRLAMIHYMDTPKRDRAKTIEYLRKASTLPGFDSLSAGMLSTLQLGQREDLVAIGYWVELLKSGSPDVRRAAEVGLFDTKMKIAMRAIREFEEKHGRKPATPEEFGTPDLMQAEVIPVVLEGLAVELDGAQKGHLVFDAKGRPRYARGEELGELEVIRTTKRWIDQFRAERGRWPTLDDFTEDTMRLPPPRRGRKWVLTDGDLRAVEE